MDSRCPGAWRCFGLSCKESEIRNLLLTIFCEHRSRPLSGTVMRFSFPLARTCVIFNRHSNRLFFCLRRYIKFELRVHIETIVFVFPETGIAIRFDRSATINDSSSP